MLARRSGAWVVPVGMVGTHKVLPKGQSRPKRHKIRVIYGKPFRYSDIEAPNEREARELFASRLQSEIIELCRANGLELKSEPSSQYSAASDPHETPASHTGQSQS